MAQIDMAMAEKQLLVYSTPLGLQGFTPKK